MGTVITQASMSLDGYIAEPSGNLFGDHAGSPLLLEDPEVVQGDRDTHLRFRLPRG